MAIWPWGHQKMHKCIAESALKSCSSLCQMHPLTFQVGRGMDAYIPMIKWKDICGNCSKYGQMVLKCKTSKQFISCPYRFLKKCFSLYPNIIDIPVIWLHKEQSLFFSCAIYVRLCSHVFIVSADENHHCFATSTCWSWLIFQQSLLGVFDFPFLQNCSIQIAFICLVNHIAKNYTFKGTVEVLRCVK